MVLRMWVEEYIYGLLVILKKLAVVQCGIILPLELYGLLVVHFHLGHLQRRSELLADLHQQPDLAPLDAAQALAYLLNKLQLFLLNPADLLDLLPRLLLNLTDHIQFFVHFLPA